MNNRSRKNIAYLNSIVTLISQCLQILLGFVVRKIFIDKLGVSYLGYNSVFNNILQMLNLAELGIGIAITSFLFKPIADGDRSRISALMYIYKKVYNIMGVIFLIIGIIISFALEVLIPDATCSFGFLRLLFYINLVGTVSTYFFAYKRTLIIADQKSYITNFVDMIMYLLISLLQILALFSVPNYIIYLSLQVAKNVISNIILSICSDKKYGKIDKCAEHALVAEYQPQIVKYVKDVFISRIGATVFYGTDNVIISVFRGSLLAGYLSNYTMITTQLTSIINQILASLQATFGNYVHSGKSINEQKEMANSYFCVNYFIGNFCMICFALLAQPFVRILFGIELLMPYSTAIWLGINLMLSILVQLPSQIFIIYKLFRYDKPIIMTSALLNIIISASLVRELGINGVLIGTFVTSLIYLFSRFYIIAKYVYKIQYRKYLIQIVLYFVFSASSLVIISFVCQGITGETVISFVIRMILVGALSILISSTFLSFTKEFKIIANKFLPRSIKRFCDKYVLISASVGLILISVIVGMLYSDNSKSIDPLNKSCERHIIYLDEDEDQDKIFHLSFDDTINCFKDIRDNKYESIFENVTLSWMKELNREFGVVITCYVYYEDERFKLTQFPNKYKKEFEENSNWLRFGFHALNKDAIYENRDIAKDYSMTISELERIVGSNSIDNVIRLQSFQGSYDAVSTLVSLDEEPVVGLLTADDSRNSYYLNKEENEYIYCHDKLYKDGCYFISTDLRMEYVGDVKGKIKELSTETWNNQIGDLVVFSHEWTLNLEVKEKIEKMCKYAVDNKYRFVFFEDVLF